MENEVETSDLKKFPAFRDRIVYFVNLFVAYAKFVWNNQVNVLVSENVKPNERIPFIRRLLMPLTFVYDKILMPKLKNLPFEAEVQYVNRFYFGGIHVAVLLKFGVLVCFLRITHAIIIILDHLVLRKKRLDTMYNSEYNFEKFLRKELYEESNVATRYMEDLYTFGYILVLLLIGLIIKYPLFMSPLQLYTSYNLLHNFYHLIGYSYYGIDRQILQFKNAKKSQMDFLETSGDAYHNYAYKQFSIMEDQQYTMDVINVCIESFWHFMMCYIVERSAQYYGTDDVYDQIHDLIIRIVRWIHCQTCKFYTFIKPNTTLETVSNANDLDANEFTQMKNNIPPKSSLHPTSNNNDFVVNFNELKQEYDN